MDQTTVSEPRPGTSNDQAVTLAVGTAPVNWNNDDLRDWRPHVPLTEMLDAMATAGYAGTEFGADFPRDPNELRSTLGSRNLELCGSYQWLHFHDQDAFQHELSALEEVLAALAGVDCRNLIVASAMTPERIALAGRVPVDGSAGWSDDEWEQFMAGLEAVKDLAARFRIQVHYHNHVGSHVESPAEVERLLGYLPDGVDLCFDTGHYAFGGGDPCSFVREHIDHVGYLHLKDVDPAVLKLTKKSNANFLDALKGFIFCDLGQGAANIPEIIATLIANDYPGWVIVEQDTCPGDQTETAKRNRNYLHEVCGV